MEPAETDAYYESGGGVATTCIGYPEAGVEIRIVDDRGQRVPSGETGEIMVRAQHMSLGLLRDGVLEPWPDMWHPTGDVGLVDERGRVHIVGRLADAIKTGGYKLYPAEIEQVISAVAGLPEIAVVGLPSAYWGEIVVAVAETSGGSWREQVSAACERLPKHKRPRLFAEMAELPRNAMHKIVRSRIVGALKEQYALEDGPYPALRRLDAARRAWE
jgi:acyl-CoA synthetase (AMP-forming)/AMP-acid ligase II